MLTIWDFDFVVFGILFLSSSFWKCCMSVEWKWEWLEDTYNEHIGEYKYLTRVSRYTQYEPNLNQDQGQKCVLYYSRFVSYIQ